MQKAIRLGLAVDESLTNSQIGEYINYRTAAYWLADDKGAGTVDLSQEASAVCRGAARRGSGATGWRDPERDGACPDAGGYPPVRDGLVGWGGYHPHTVVVVV